MVGCDYFCCFFWVNNLLLKLLCTSNWCGTVEINVEIWSSGIYIILVAILMKWNHEFKSLTLEIFGLFCWQIDDIVKAMGELSQKWKIVDEFLSWDIILRALWLETESIGEFCPMKGNAQALSIMTMKSQHGHWTIAWADLHLYYFVNAICFLVWINESLSLSLSLSHTHTHTHTHTHFFK